MELKMSMKKKQKKMISKSFNIILISEFAEENGSLKAMTIHEPITSPNIKSWKIKRLSSFWQNILNLFFEENK